MARVRLPAPVAPGEWAEVRVAFRLQIPDRLSSFGRRGQRIFLEGGALPFVPEADREGRRDPRLPPVRARYDLARALTRYRLAAGELEGR